MVEFCPSCDSVLYPKKKEGKKYLVCKQCGYEKSADGADLSAFTLSETIDHAQDKTLVMDEKYYKEQYGDNVSDRSCPRCGGKMIHRQQQTRSADEGITHFFICVKCQKMIRLYS